MSNDNCNTNNTTGCSNDQNYAEIKSAQTKLLPKLVSIESTLDSFKQTLSDYCDLEGENLTQIDNKLSSIVDINQECCNIINLKLEELISVLENIENCEDYCQLEGDVECDMTTTTTTETTTTTTIEMTTTTT